MVTTQEVLDISKALTEGLDRIHAELGLEEASRFRRELGPRLDRFTNATDSDILEKTIDEIWQICCRYPFVKGLIIGYGIGHNTERRSIHWRKLEAADFRDDPLVREIVNRFQALSDGLEEAERSAEGTQGMAKQERRPIRYRGGQ